MQRGLGLQQPSDPCSLLHPPCYKSDISTHHSVRLVYVPKNSGAGGNETAYVFTRDSSAEQFAGNPTDLMAERNT